MTENNGLACAMNFTPGWWTFVLMGLFALIMGTAALLWTPFVILFFGYFIGALVIVYGIITIIQGAKSHEGAGASAALIILGILAVVLGFFAISNILSAWLLVTYLIAFWALMTGFTDFWMAFTGNGGIGYKILLVIAGLLSLFVGFYIMMFPGIGTETMIWILGIFAVAWGIVMVITGLMFRGKTPKEISSSMSEEQQ
jgi:uncharacterized membrane protein HdeD (DUF308 family)